MFRVAAFTIVCAFAAAQSNFTNVDKNLLRKLSTLVNANKTIDRRTLLAFNKTFSDELAAKLGSLVDLDKLNIKNKSADNKTDDDTEPYDVYEMPGRTKPSIAHVEESPDYASSVVLASDLLSLTSAVSNIKEEECRKQGLKFLDGLLENKRWALKMFDASSKSPQGLLFGSSYHLGNFDECVDTKSKEDGVDIEGQYCLATIRWPQAENQKVRTGRGETLRWAVCVPNACDARSVQDFVSGVISRTVGNTTTVAVTSRDCFAREPLTVSTKDMVYLAVILFFVAIFLMSTLYEVYSLSCGSNKQTITHELIIAFSAIHNIKKIISTKQNTSLGLECIAGIKALAMIFILAGHSSLFVGAGPVMDASGWDNLIRSPLLSLITNSMLLVDTFLMISAFLFCRLLLIELDKKGGKLNVLPILIFRYIRLTPAYLAVLFFYMTWFPKIGEGPLWKDKILLEKERCEKSWWTNILYVNNYVDTENMCMFQSWYLSVDTQLFFLAPIFIYSLWRWRRVGPSILGVTLFIGTIVPAIITYKDNLDPTLLVYAKELYDIISNYYFNVAYIKTHMKMPSYFLGLLTGYLLHRIQKENYELSRTVKTLGWIVSVILGSMTIFTVSIFYQDWYIYNRIESAAYTSLPRLAWGLSNGWLIIACATGNGGIMTKLFTWKFLVPFSRLTYCAYLVNGIVELFAVGQLRHPLHVDIVNMTFTCVAHIIITFTLGMLLCIIFESPIHGIEKVLLRMFAQPVLSDNAVKNKSTESFRNSRQSRLES
ncbi:unnamed protein product [Diatraea saccharalis]|uniref:Nose resistant-to-fluoxetine protein N-terminal domain-containing protein n=1 Tax=Diatraea saccharalis TaxID=40085 RepID=A0A9N9R8J4_9NEOP|nr:unnamed protein product [Diatraea saccharalis]